ncbi:aspartate/glutamate racemase family protein [Chloroflexota bacterium]
MRDRVVGILGGVGPEATAELFRKIIKATSVRSEQEHLRIIIDNNPKIPDRTLAILDRGESPLEELIKTALNLERASAEIIAIPCNTAHYYLDDLRNNVHVPVIDMISETANYILRQYPKIEKLGLLATVGTIKTQLYQRKLKPRKVLLPDSKSQQELMGIIYGDMGIKLGFTQGPARRSALSIAQSLVARGAEAIILGCTELSLVLSEQDISTPLIDPLQILALAIVREAKSEE